MKDSHPLPPSGGSSRPAEQSVRGEMAGMDLGMRVLSYLIAGVLVYGGLGWLADRYLGTGFLLPIGIVLGAAGGCYVIIKRYGQVLPVPAGTSPADTGLADQSHGTGSSDAGLDKREGAR